MVVYIPQWYIFPQITLSNIQYSAEIIYRFCSLSSKNINVTNDASWENRIFALAKTKAQISCAVTAQLISAFVFAARIVLFLSSSS